MPKPIKLIVSVTRRDIERGKRNSCIRCPIALALRRRFPDARLVAITISGARVEWGLRDTPLVASLPQKAMRFVGLFDASRARAKVKPMRFELTFAPER